MKLHIYYRHTPVARSSGKSRPAWFTHERCFLNLLSTIEHKLATASVRLNIVFDGEEADHTADFGQRHIQNLIARLPAAQSAITQRRIEGGDQRKAWRACVNVVRADAESVISAGDVIYLLENDYMHVPGWVDEVGQLDQQGVPWEYLTLYDHPDKYPNHCKHPDSARYRNLTSRIFATPRRHWRTVPSTCATYLIRKETFLEDFSILRLGLYDLRLFRLLRSLRCRQLMSPIPAMATHCMEGLLAPAVDWEREIHSSPGF